MRLLARLENERKPFALWYVSFRQSPKTCEQCSTVNVIACIEDPVIVKRVLDHLADRELEPNSPKPTLSGRLPTKLSVILNYPLHTFLSRSCLQGFALARHTSYFSYPLA